MKIKHAHVTIYLQDMERSIAFYTSIGFTLKQRWDNHYAIMEAPGIEIGLHPADESRLSGNSGNLSIGFTTDDFEKTKAQMAQAGIAHTERKEKEGDFLNFTDPDGTALYFILPKW